MKRVADPAIIEQLQRQILTLQGNRQHPGEVSQVGLGSIESAFPDGIFPRASVHELISLSTEEASCTNGFIAVILGKLMQQGGCCLWISTKRKVFPPALKTFGIEPERILFVDTMRAKDALWTIEEALKCNALSAVVGEISELDFNASRRLQLAVERSKVTGFIHRHQPKAINAVACVSRWKITPLASGTYGEMPGVGNPRWRIQLLKARNGKPGEWLVEWTPQGLEYISKEVIVTPETYQRNTA
jgi:protein ImuA